MNNKFYNALTTNDTLTENGMPTHSTSGTSLLDFFFKMGALRGQEENKKVNLFSKAFYENPLLATKAMFYNRDIREGQGERDTFRTILRYLAINHPEVVKKNLSLIPEYGRWDDLAVLMNTPVEQGALTLIQSTLQSDSDGGSLLAKWLPREGKKDYDTFGEKVRKFMDLTPREYRLLLVRKTKVVETQMCKKEWSKINYSAVPSKASSLYSNAFKRHDPERYGEFIKKAIKGEVKINSGAIFPSDIVHAILNRGGNEGTHIAQWNQLPDFVGEGSFIPVCDVSGSMMGQPLEVCIALGIYLSERNKSEFKDMFITFSHTPKLQKLRGNIVERVNQLQTANWAMNTDLEKVFRLILDKAVNSGLKNEDLPKNILILSDMQFDACINTPNNNGYSMITRMYEEAGYTLPNVIFWNLRDSSGVPVKFDERGTALVSGYSPSIMKNLLGGNFTPESIMLKTLNSSRYERVRI